MSCGDTDFILDAEVVSAVLLATKGVTPTAKELYDVYLKTRPSWLGIILQESIRRGYQLILIDMIPTPFEQMKQALDETIYRFLEY